eukprot:5225871-Pyramimonas_sp.AAC.2
MAIGSDRAKKAKRIDFPKVLDGFWPLRGLLGELFDHSEPSWSGLGASWNIAGAIFGILAYLEPSWRSCWVLPGALGVNLSGAPRPPGGQRVVKTFVQSMIL